jgi:predicted phosphatase
MNKFFIPAHFEQKAIQIFKDLKISENDIKSIDRYKWDFFEVKEIFERRLKNNPLATPLFSMIDDTQDKALKYREAALAVMDIINSLDLIELDSEKPANDKIDSKLVQVMSCDYLLQLLGERIFYLDYRDYKFDDAYQMMMVLSVYIFNELEYKDSREQTIHDIENNIIYNYANHIHGDFRFESYDLNHKLLNNPFNENEKLPFSKIDLKNIIAGYHSTEPSFLVALLMLAHNKKDKTFVKNIPNWIKDLKSTSQVFGNFADAGMNSIGSAVMSFSGFESNFAGYVGVECSDSYYKAIIKDGILNYYLYQDRQKFHLFSISPDIVDDLICALFKKAANGNGRTSVAELIEVLEFYVDNYGT